MKHKNIFRIVVMLLVLTIFAQVRTAAPQAAIAEQKTEDPALPRPPEEVAIDSYPQATGIKVDPSPYKAMLYAIAKEKGLSDEKVKEIEVTIGGNGNPLCPNGESGWHTNAVGDHGTSFGLVQIHLPAHPGITKEQAFDPSFALNFIVDEFLKGNEWKWTCWKAVYDN